MMLYSFNVLTEVPDEKEKVTEVAQRRRMSTKKLL